MSRMNEQSSRKMKNLKVYRDKISKNAPGKSENSQTKNHKRRKK